MRVLVTGMGGELGSRVAQLLEARNDVTEVVGFDFVPPRRRLHSSIFRRIDPTDREAVTAFVEDVAPEVVVHLGVYEPHARTSPGGGAAKTTVGSVAALGAAGRAGRLQKVVVRSGIEVYGRGRHFPTVPDEDVPPAPASLFGHLCLETEVLAAGLGRREGVPVVALRFAPLVGSHAPSPLGRLLRLPAVPVNALGDPPFCVLHGEDAARAIVTATVTEVSGPFNVVAPGAASPWQAVRLGGRIPLPVAGPGWPLARAAAELAGAPVPDHVTELLVRGRVADGSRALSALGLTGMVDTQSVLTELFEWASVTPIRAAAVA